MSVADELDTLRATVPGCTLVAFGDLNARIVLCASAAEKPLQEELDALCLSASGALDGGFAGPVAGFLGGSQLAEAVTLGGGENRLFLRSHLDSADALFCIFSGQTHISDMVEAGRKTLHRISERP